MHITRQAKQSTHTLRIYAWIRTTASTLVENKTLYIQTLTEILRLSLKRRRHATSKETLALFFVFYTLKNSKYTRKKKK